MSKTYTKATDEAQALCSMKTTKKPSEYPGLRVRNWYGSSSIECDYYAQHDMPKQIHENDWIPMITAARLVGVSKQALSDRIRRGTIECKPGRSSRYAYSENVNMVRLMDCRKKKKAGRPKGSRGRVKELKREGYEIPVYFLYQYKFKNKWHTTFIKYQNGNKTNYTDQTYTVIDEEYGAPTQQSEKSIKCDIYNMRKNTYGASRSRCRSIEVRPEFQTHIEDFIGKL